MIVYFTGTGNSRYVANAIAAVTKDKILCANEYIKSECGAFLGDDRPLVLVAPVYVSAPPTVFWTFLRRSAYQGNRKVYFVLTCAGGMGASPAYCEDMALELGLTYMGTASVIMPQNYLIYFKTKEAEENERTIRQSMPVIRGIAQTIKKQEYLPESGMKRWEHISTQLVLGSYYRWFMNDKAFRAGDSCIGCGKCASVCPLANIMIDEVEKTPVWKGNCTHCMACINSCPVEAIEYGKRTHGKPRYFCREFQPSKKKGEQIKE